jgi:hypothetical protein
LFFYIHITAQYKKSEELEIYETDFESNSSLQDICDMRQPFLFEYKKVNEEFFEKINPEKLSEVAGSYDIKIKEITDYWKETDTVDYVVLPWNSSRNLMSTNSTANYFTENNNDYIEEAGIVGAFSKNDVFLKPNGCGYTKYDIMMGAKGVATPLKYHMGHREFVCVQSGKVMVKMTPWKSKKYLYPVHDFEKYEFWSPVNVWKPQPKYLHEMDKLRFIEFDMSEGQVLYIPPYWFYSIQYMEADTMVAGFSYYSIMNCLANLPNWARYYLQQLNIEKKAAKTIIEEKEISEDDLEIIEIEILPEEKIEDTIDV